MNPAGTPGTTGPVLWSGNNLKETFPATDDEFNRFAALVLCVFDINENDVVREIPVSTAPLHIQWDESGDFPVPGPDPGIIQPESFALNGNVLPPILMETRSV